MLIHKHPSVPNHNVPVEQHDEYVDPLLKSTNLTITTINTNTEVSQFNAGFDCSFQKGKPIKPCFSSKAATNPTKRYTCTSATKEKKRSKVFSAVDFSWGDSSIHGSELQGRMSPYSRTPLGSPWLLFGRGRTSLLMAVMAVCPHPAAYLLAGGHPSFLPRGCATSPDACTSSAPPCRGWNRTQLGCSASRGLIRRG